jgi:hypothetical protein
MITVTSNPRLPEKQAPTKVVTGQHIAKAHRAYTPWQRAEDAARWIKSEVQIVPTVKLAASVFNVSVPLVMKARAILDERSRRKHRANGSTTLSDAVVERIVTEVGPNRILHALDRVTQPQLPLQAAE